jgi:hypothetical protein
MTITQEKPGVFGSVACNQDVCPVDAFAEKPSLRKPIPSVCIDCADATALRAMCPVGPESANGMLPTVMTEETN